MNIRHTGGPAFPTNTKTYEADNGDVVHIVAGGATLRDYFAARAMEAILLVSYQQGWKEVDEVAEHAYRAADAMLAARGDA